MNISGFHQSKLSLSGGHQEKLKQSRENMENSKKEGQQASHTAPVMLTISQKEKKVSMVEALMQRKEHLQERIANQTSQLANIKSMKAEVPYEEVVSEFEGRVITIKSYSEADQKILDRLNTQEANLQARKEGAMKELAAFEGQIQEAMMQENQNKVEEQKKEAKEKLKSENKNPKTEEELSQAKEKRQMEFMLQSGAIKQYVHTARAAASKLEGLKTRKESEMAIDKNNQEQADQRALASELQTQLAARLGVKKEDVTSPISEIADTSALQEKRRIESGKFSLDETDDATEIKKLKDAISRVQDSINAKMSDINKESRKQTEKESNENKEISKKDEQKGNINNLEDNLKNVESNIQA